ncbi:hypothetical protein GCM10010304_63050 [Streptomyces roseoviolaceus]
MSYRLLALLTRVKTRATAVPCANSSISVRAAARRTRGPRRRDQRTSGSARATTDSTISVQRNGVPVRLMP